MPHLVGKNGMEGKMDNKMNAEKMEFGLGREEWKIMREYKF